MEQRDEQVQTALTTFPGQTEPSSPRQADYTLAADVLLVCVPDGAGRLLDMGGQCYAMPAIGAQMLQGVLQQSTSATVHAITEWYGVDA